MFMLSDVGPEKVKRQSRKIILLLLFNLGSCSNVLFQADLDSISPPVLVQHLTQPGPNSTNRAVRLSQNQRRRSFDKHLPQIHSVHKASCVKDVESSPLPYRKEHERQSFCDAKGSLFPYQNVPQERGKGYLLLFISLNEYLTELLSPHGRATIDFEDPNKGGKAEFIFSFYH